MNEQYFENEAENYSDQIDSLNIHSVRALLNVLLESPFFYQTDDPDLFAYLRLNQEAIGHFFMRYFGWELYVDRQAARIIKPQLYNNSLKPSQRDMFDLTRRDECSVFMLLLEFYEKLLRDFNSNYDDDKRLRFLISDFVQYCFNRFNEELEDGESSEKAIVDACRTLFPKLIKYRFIEQKEKADVGKDERLPEGLEQQVMYEFLPGIHCYRPDVLTFKEIARLYSKTDSLKSDGEETAEEENEQENF